MHRGIGQGLSRSFPAGFAPPKSLERKRLRQKEQLYHFHPILGRICLHFPVGGIIMSGSSPSVAMIRV